MTARSTTTTHQGEGEVAGRATRARSIAGLVVFVSLIIGVVVRAAPVLPAAFPLNDGGLFSVMSAELTRNGLVWPAFTTYNHGSIPFAYPPFGLYVDAVARQVFGLHPDVALRVIPLVFAVASVPAFYFMARAWAGPMTASVATFAWAVLPRSWIWLVAGGGLTRAPGLVFAFLAVGAASRFMSRGERRYMLLGGLTSGLALLSHLEAAAFIFATLAAAWLVRDRRVARLGRLASMASIGLVIAAPWWLNVAAVHGFGPFLAAGQSRWLWLPLAGAMLLGFRFTAEPFFAIGAIFGSTGLVLNLARGRYWLPVWLVAIFLVIPGAAPTYGMAPLALLIATGGQEVSRLMPMRRRAVAAISVGVISVFVSLWAPYLSGGLLTSVSADQRSAMETVRETTAPDSQWLVVTGADWGYDGLAEWFPVLTGRRAINTVQGLEFSSPEQWIRAVDASDGIERCSNGTAQCLIAWREQWNANYDYVFIPVGPGPGFPEGDCCPLLVDSLRTDGRFRELYAMPGAFVFEAVRGR